MSAQRPTHIALPRSSSFNQSTPGQPLRSPSSPAGTTIPLVSPNSPRNSFLPSFMRTRPRAATLTRPSTGGTTNPSSPNVESGNPLDTSSSDAVGGAARLGNMLRRRISNQNGGSLATPRAGGSSRVGLDEAEGSAASSESRNDLPPSDVVQKTYRIRLVPHLESSRSLPFDPVVRDLVEVRPGSSPPFPAPDPDSATRINDRPVGYSLKIGRFTEKSTATAEAGAGAPVLIGAGGGGETTSTKVAFRSKVVSRAHAEIWCEKGGKFFIRDSASSSGSFLNHIRLANPNTLSGPFGLKDGDILQLGVDYQGGAEEMYRCIKMRVEVGREWQREANEFNTNAMKQLKELGGHSGVETASINGSIKNKDKKKANVTDCCICLFSVTICQSLFIAPCSHVFHYKCIRPLLTQHHPGFSCPLCRTFANLEEDVEVEDAWGPASRRNSIFDRRVSATPAAALAPEVNLDTDPNSGSVNTSSRLATSEADADAAAGDSSTDEELNMEGMSISRRSEPAESTMADQAATPMNSTFLSTLAETMPGGSR